MYLALSLKDTHILTRAHEPYTRLQEKPCHIGLRAALHGGYLWHISTSSSASYFWAEMC
jgi:hypothetical protein